MANIHVSSKATRQLLADFDEVRLARNLTYDQLATEVGLSRRTVIRLLMDRDTTMFDRTERRLRDYVESQRAVLDPKPSQSARP